MRYFLFFLLFSIGINSQVTRHRKVILMGSRFDITIVDKDSLSSENKIDIAINEIRRIENLISEWQENTIISEVNRMRESAQEKLLHKFLTLPKIP